VWWSDLVVVTSVDKISVARTGEAERMKRMCVLGAVALTLAACGAEPDAVPRVEPSNTSASVPSEYKSQHRMGIPFVVYRSGVDALVWVDEGRHDVDGEQVVGDISQFTVTVEVFGGSWRFGPDLIACVADGKPGPASLDFGPKERAEMKVGVRRYWKVACTVPAATNLDIAVYFSPGELLATWD